MEASVKRTDGVEARLMHEHRTPDCECLLLATCAFVGRRTYFSPLQQIWRVMFTVIDFPTACEQLDLKGHVGSPVRIWFPKCFKYARL